MDIRLLFEEARLTCGRMIAGSKRAPEGQKCVWNANIVIASQGKVWYGDLNITKEGNILKLIATKLGEPLYVLREMDARFSTEKDTPAILISRAVWSTDGINKL